MQPVRLHAVCCAVNTGASLNATDMPTLAALCFVSDVRYSCVLLTSTGGQHQQLGICAAQHRASQSAKPPHPPRLPAAAPAPRPCAAACRTTSCARCPPQTQTPRL
eukprot:365205-Chlamydomonas_euryale.AAC.22